MTTSAELLTDAFGRIREAVHDAVDGLSPEQLSWRADPASNTIAWLVWHLTRIQDDHIADVAQTKLVWTTQGWMERFGLPFRPRATGYGHTAEDVAAVRVKSPDLLIGYHDAVSDQTIKYVSGLTDADLDRIVDTRWDPPVTLGVRLISVIADDLQHAGQAAFLRDIIERQ